MAIRLDGKVAVVTGSGRGLGFAYARALAEAGASVVINDMDAAAAEEAVKKITEAGGQAVAEIVPVGTAESADAIVKRAVDSFGRLDILVTNAGVLRDRVLWNMSDADFDLVIQTHLRGTFTCVRSAFKQMRAQGEGGRIITIGSPAGQSASFGQTNYSAAKAGIVGFTRTWAVEFAKFNVTVNAIVPTALTQMTVTIPGLDQYAEAVNKGEEVELPHELRASLGLPEDVAPMIVFLASDEAKEVTGQCIGVGGEKISLWSHPKEVRQAFKDGGWTPEAIAADWSRTIGQQLEPYAPQRNK
ncbi:MAG: 3-oxoacyl-ACP reductase [Chloroflexi bacterium 54-19]|nr:MAG: 3-oxoacyl-ACP reductase [Chloroflexi bacterium 54-19]